MVDTFGGITVPVGESADPALALIGDYLRTMLNANARDGFELGSYGEGDPVVGTFQVNPNGHVFDDCELPALFVYAPSGQYEQASEDWFEDVTALKVVWMLPVAADSGVDSRREFFRPVARVIAAAVRALRSPLWQRPEDTEVGALDVAASVDSLVLTVATTLAPLTLSGAGLTGQRAGTTFAPRLAPTVTTSVTGIDAYNTTSPMLWTVVDWYGRTKTLAKTLTLPRGGETLTVGEDVVSVTSVYQPAHLSTVGSVSFGTAAWAGRGSSLLRLASLASLTAGPWRQQPLTVTELNGDGATKPARSAIYEALEMDMKMREVEAIDHTAHYHLGGGLDIDTVVSDDLTLASRSLPDPP